MSSEDRPAQSLEKVGMAVETSPSRSQPSKKNQGKIPKKIHKAEREKMKRDNLNELFLALANVLEASEQTNGKASLLGETIRTVKDILGGIESLRRENAALLSESQYVTMEKEELQEENSVLAAQIAELQNELKSVESKIDLNAAPPECQHHDLAQHCIDDCSICPTSESAFEQAQYLKPLYYIPICSDPGNIPDPHTPHVATPLSVVNKPHARYPSQSDTWPSQLLEKHP